MNRFVYLDLDDINWKDMPTLEAIAEADPVVQQRLFTTHLQKDHHEWKRKRPGHVGSRFLGHLNKYGGVFVANELLQKPMKKDEVGLEVFILEHWEYWPLFSDAQLAECKKRVNWYYAN